MATIQEEEFISLAVAGALAVLAHKMADMVDDHDCRLFDDAEVGILNEAALMILRLKHQQR